jgi:hypothetical protein
VRCTDHKRALAVWAVFAVLAGCASPPPPPPAAPRPPPAPVAARPVAPAPAPAAVPAKPADPGRIAAPGPVRNIVEVRAQAARRLVAANPTTTYIDAPPDPLLAIPVLEIELNGDGSIRSIDVMRKPSQALDTVQLAIDAVRRAAPFGDVSRIAKPWKFTETFLFRDDRKFKPRTLDN